MRDRKGGGEWRGSGERGGRQESRSLCVYQCASDVPTRIGCTRIQICKREERRKLPEKGKGRARRPRMRSGPGGQKSLTKNTAYANEASKRTRKSPGHTSRGKNAAAHPPRPPSSPATDPSGPLLRTAPTGVGDHKGRDRPPGEQTDRMRG